MLKSFKNNSKIKEEEIIDTGLSSKYQTRTQRLVNRDGSFNVERKGLSFRETFNLYHWLINISWIKFIILVALSFLLINLIFAALYYLNGIENLGINENHSALRKFLESFFFSTQTITTVGYGRVSPVNLTANVIASIESFIGLLAFAFATGLLYGRFSKPFASIIYSKYAVIAPFKDITGLMFRTANKQKSQIIDAEAQVVFSRLENIDGTEVRKFYNIPLEYKKINFFSSVWTINHPIDENSPLYGSTKEDIHKSETEILILLKGYDDTFAQTVHSRFSYRNNEIIWGAKFKNVHITNEEGKVVVSLDKISDFEKAKLPGDEN